MRIFHHLCNLLFTDFACWALLLTVHRGLQPLLNTIGIVWCTPELLTFFAPVFLQILKSKFISMNQFRLEVSSTVLSVWKLLKATAVIHHEVCSVTCGKAISWVTKMFTVLVPGCGSTNYQLFPGELLWYSEAGTKVQEEDPEHVFHRL